jgi:hypothetical protein
VINDIEPFAHCSALLLDVTSAIWPKEGHGAWALSSHERGLDINNAQGAREEKSPPRQCVEGFGSDEG